MNDPDPNFALTLTDGLFNTEFSATNLALALGQVGLTNSQGGGRGWGELPDFFLARLIFFLYLRVFF